MEDCFRVADDKRGQTMIHKIRYDVQFPKSYLFQL